MTLHAWNILDIIFIKLNIQAPYLIFLCLAFLLDLRPELGDLDRLALDLLHLLTLLPLLRLEPRPLTDLLPSERLVIGIFQ